MILPATRLLLTAALFVGALALAAATAAASPGPMQVEEPDVQAAQPPIQPDRDGEGWKSRKNASLSASQQAALKARQDTMKDMMALIQQKRRAIREARPQDRQALAQELHQIILEQAQGGDRKRGRAEVRKDAVTEARNQEAALEQRDRALEQREEYFRETESHRQQAEDKLKQAEPKSAPESKKAED